MKAGEGMDHTARKTNTSDVTDGRRKINMFMESEGRRGGEVLGSWRRRVLQSSLTLYPPGKQRQSHPVT